MESEQVAAGAESSISHPVKHHAKHIDKKELWIIIGVIVALVAIIALSTWIRTLNIHDLKDVTTGNYTLGPDLDPFWFFRGAQEIVKYGHKLNPDMLRAAPLGWPILQDIHSHLIAGTYKLLHAFNKNISLEFAADIFPVIFFALTLIVFFLFLERLLRPIMTKNKRLLACLIATALLAVISDMLHRTMGGIPEHEGPGIFFTFLAFYFFTWTWQTKNGKTWILAALAGIATALSMLAWSGGAIYIFMIIALFTLISFIIGKVGKKEAFIYAIWLIVAIAVSALITKHLDIVGLAKSVQDTGFALAILAVLIVDVLLWDTKLKKMLKLEKIRLPRGITSLIVILAIGLIVLLLTHPGTVSQLFSKIVDGLLYPFGRGRVGLTVAENKAPYFADVFGTFGWLFWLFFFGAIALFYEAVSHFDKKKKVWLNTLFIVFLVTFIFSRISSQSLLNGENFISRFLYFGGLALFIIILLWIYIGAYIGKDEKTMDDFKGINFSYLFLLVYIFWMMVSMRGALRLFFVISPLLIMIPSILSVRLAEYSIKAKDHLGKMLLWCGVILVAVLLIITFIGYTKASIQEAKATVPGPYAQQWQKAMAWVRESTPEDSIFAHWWDYGDWVQTIGERPTILDGQHAVRIWNYFMGRYVLCGQNETEALEFLYAHNASYLLIDSSDIGKYPAYSSIGSDESGKDKLSWISTFILDESKTEELRNETRYVYVGGTMLDQDIMWQGQLFPQDKAGIGAFIMSIDENKQVDNITAIIVYNSKQILVPIRYIYINEKLVDIAGEKEALNSTLYIMPTLTQQGVNNFGGALYLSEKLMNSNMVKLYLLNETENFELVHSEPALFVQQLKNVYNVSMGDFLIANDIYGPIKIFKVNYPQGFTVDSNKTKRYLQTENDLPFSLY
jgi:asparagine N-glycosylation enzyme membrane subunit Stt3